MKCPHCGKNIEVPKKKQTNKETYDRFLKKWNTQGIIRHKKVTTTMKKAIDKVIKNDDYTFNEIFIAFKNYATILKAPQYVWSYRWTMEDFLIRGLYKFVDEAQPFANNNKDCILNKKSNSPYENFDCGGSSY